MRLIMRIGMVIGFYFVAGIVYADDAAPVVKPVVGTISGKLDKPDQVLKIFAIDRTQLDRNLEKAARIIVEEGKVSPDGTFSIPVQSGKRYDVIVDYRDGSRLEGVNLNVKRSDFIEEDPPLSKLQAEKIRKIIALLNKFENEIEVMSLTGNAQHAVALLNKRRTTPFINSIPGEIIWRLEVWRFEKPEDGDYWLKDPEELFVIYYRERLPRAKYDAKMIMLDAKLGGLSVSEKSPKVDLGPIAMPEAKTGIRLRNAPPAPVEKSDLDQP